ncbi:MAG: hypothetical protein WCJ74_00960 [bacterium]
MTIYNAVDLNSDLQFFITSVSNVSRWYFEFFSIQSITGCRFIELKELSRWSVADETHLLLFTAKGSAPRLFKKSAFPPFFVKAITDSNNYFFSITNATASYYFKVFYPKKKVFHLQHPLTTHLFRHNFAKQLHLSNYTRADVQLEMGEKSIFNSNIYIDSVLTY